MARNFGGLIHVLREDVEDEMLDSPVEDSGETGDSEENEVEDVETEGSPVEKVTVLTSDSVYDKGCYVSIPIPEDIAAELKGERVFYATAIIVALNQFLVDQGFEDVSIAGVETPDDSMLSFSVLWSGGQDSDAASMLAFMQEFVSGLHDHPVLSLLGQADPEPQVHGAEYQVEIQFPTPLDDAAVSAYIEQLSSILGQWDDENGVDGNDLSVRFVSYSEYTLVVAVDSPTEIPEDVFVKQMPEALTDNDEVEEETPEEESPETEDEPSETVEGVVKKGRTSQAVREATDLDSVGAHELKLFIDNDSRMYNQYTSIVKNLVAKIGQGRYDHELSKKLWLYLVDAGAQTYAKEFGDGVTLWYQMFDKATRAAVAVEFADHFRTEWNLGAYKHYLPKKYLSKDGSFPKLESGVQESRKPGKRGRKLGEAASKTETDQSWPKTYADFEQIKTRYSAYQTERAEVIRQNASRRMKQLEALPVPALPFKPVFPFAFAADGTYEGLVLGGPDKVPEGTQVRWLHNATEAKRSAGIGDPINEVMGSHKASTLKEDAVEAVRKPKVIGVQKSVSSMSGELPGFEDYKQLFSASPEVMMGRKSLSNGEIWDKLNEMNYDLEEYLATVDKMESNAYSIYEWLKSNGLGFEGNTDADESWWGPTTSYYVLQADGGDDAYAPCLLFLLNAGEASVFWLDVYASDTPWSDLQLHVEIATDQGQIELGSADDEAYSFIIYQDEPGVLSQDDQITYDQLMSELDWGQFHIFEAGKKYRIASALKEGIDDSYDDQAISPYMAAYTVGADGGLTGEDLDAFADYADIRCRAAWEVQADWIVKIMRSKSNAGRDHLYVFLKHWLDKWNGGAKVESVNPKSRKSTALKESSDYPFGHIGVEDEFRFYGSQVLVAPQFPAMKEKPWTGIIIRCWNGGTLWDIHPDWVEDMRDTTRVDSSRILEILTTVDAKSPSTGSKLESVNKKSRVVEQDETEVVHFSEEMDFLEVVLEMFDLPDLDSSQEKKIWSGPYRDFLYANDDPHDGISEEVLGMTPGAVRVVGGGASPIFMLKMGGGSAGSDDPAPAVRESKSKSRKIVRESEEIEGGSDLESHAGEKYITTTYETVYPPDDEDEEVSDANVESGWYDEEGEDMIDDDYDSDEEVDEEDRYTAVDNAEDFLRKKGADPSGNYFHPGMWYSAEEGQDTDGTYTTYSYHLNGFTPEEEEEIFLRITGKKARKESKTRSRKTRVVEGNQSYFIDSDDFGDDWPIFPTQEAAAAFVRSEVPKMVKDQYCDGGTVGVYGVNFGVPAQEIIDQLIPEYLQDIKPFPPHSGQVKESKTLREGTVEPDGTIECGFAITTPDWNEMREAVRDDFANNEEGAAWFVAQGIASLEDWESWMAGDRISKLCSKAEGAVLGFLDHYFGGARSEGHDSEALIGTVWIKPERVEEASQYCSDLHNDPLAPVTNHEIMSQRTQGLDPMVTWILDFTALSFFDWPKKDGEPWDPADGPLGDEEKVTEKQHSKGTKGDRYPQQESKDQCVIQTDTPEELRRVSQMCDAAGWKYTVDGVSLQVAGNGALVAESLRTAGVDFAIEAKKGPRPQKPKESGRKPKSKGKGKCGAIHAPKSRPRVDVEESTEYKKVPGRVRLVKAVHGMPLEDKLYQGRVMSATLVSDTAAWGEGVSLAQVVGDTGRQISLGPKDFEIVGNDVEITDPEWHPESTPEDLGGVDSDKGVEAPVEEAIRVEPYKADYSIDLVSPSSEEVAQASSILRRKSYKVGRPVRVGSGWMVTVSGVVAASGVEARQYITSLLSLARLTVDATAKTESKKSPKKDQGARRKVQEAVTVSPEEYSDLQVVEIPTEKLVLGLLAAPRNFTQSGVNFESDDLDGSIDGPDALARLLETYPDWILKDSVVMPDTTALTFVKSGLLDYMQDSGEWAGDATLEFTSEILGEQDAIIAFLRSSKREFGVDVDLFDFYTPVEEGFEENDDEVSDR